VGQNHIGGQTTLQGNGRSNGAQPMISHTQGTQFSHVQSVQPKPAGQPPAGQPPASPPASRSSGHHR
jgi:hypothetical protein